MIFFVIYTNFYEQSLFFWQLQCGRGKKEKVFFCRSLLRKDSWWTVGDFNYIIFLRSNLLLYIYRVLIWDFKDKVYYIIVKFWRFYYSFILYYLIFFIVQNNNWITFYLFIEVLDFLGYFIISWKIYNNKNYVFKYICWIYMCNLTNLVNNRGSSSSSKSYFF